MHFKVLDADFEVKLITKISSGLVVVFQNSDFRLSKDLYGF